MKKVLYLLFALFSFSLAHSAVLDTDRKEEKKIEIKNLTVDYSIDLIALFQVERKEFGILEYLMRHPNEVISQEELLEHVWGTMTNVFSNTVRVHIQSLREKLEDDRTTPKYIETVISTGYRFVQLEYESTEDIPNKESANE